MFANRHRDTRRSPNVPQAVEFFILFCQLPVNVSFDLIQLELDPQGFAFFVLQRALRHKTHGSLELTSSQQTPMTSVQANFERYSDALSESHAVG